MGQGRIAGIRWPASFETPLRRLLEDQRLSWRSSGLPWFFVPQDGVEDGEELAGDGDEGDDFGFPAATSLSGRP